MYESDSIMREITDNVFQNNGNIPVPIVKIFPNMTLEKYMVKKSDPLFLYENLRICTDCYKQVKLMLMKTEETQK